MTDGLGEDGLAQLRNRLSDRRWRQRQTAVADLVAHGKESVEAAADVLKVVLPLFESEQPWRARAAALQVLKGCDQEAHLKLLDQLAFPEKQAVEPEDATADCENTEDVEIQEHRETDHEMDGDRVVADIPIPVHLEGRPEDDDALSLTSLSSLLKTESEVTEAVQLPPSAAALLGAVAAQVGDARRTCCGVAEQLDLARVARLAFEGGDSQMQLAALRLLADFGGSSDLHQLLKEAARKEDASVRQEAAIAASNIAGRYPGKANAEATAKLLARLLDDEDALVRREAARGLSGLDMRSLHAPRLSLLCPLLRALSDQDPDVRCAAADGLLSKAQQLLKMPQSVWHGHGQQAGVGLAAIRTAAGDEVEALLLHIFQESKDWWCFQAAVTLALSLSGSVKNKAWDVLLERLSFSSGAAVARGVGHLSDDFRTTSSVRLGMPQPVVVDRERTEDALKHLESSWWRLRMQATQVLTEAVQSGCYDAGMGVVKKLSHTSSRVRMAAVSILSHIARCLPDVLVRTTEGLLERLSDPVADVRSAASATFVRIASNGVFDDQALRALLRPLLQGPSAEERRVCSQVLLSISEVSEHGPRLAMMICGIIVRALMTSDVNGSDAKNVALSLLAQITPRKHGPALTLLTRMAKHDEDASVRLAALDALHKVAGEGSKHLQEAALHLVLDEDDVVRDAAAEMLEHLDLTNQEAEEPSPEEVLEEPEPPEGPAGHKAAAVAEEAADDAQIPGPVSDPPMELPPEMVQEMLREASKFQSFEQIFQDNEGLVLEDQEALLSWVRENFQKVEVLGPGTERLSPGPKYPMGVSLDELRVLQVFQDSPAEKAGILPEDIIQKMNDVEITTQEELRKELNHAGPKHLVLERGGQEVEVCVHVGSGFADASKNQEVPGTIPVAMPPRDGETPPTVNDERCPAVDVLRRWPDVVHIHDIYI